jgi:uncharacterized membrane protein (DUF485 family)
VKKKMTPDELGDTDKFRAMLAKTRPVTSTKIPYLVATLIAFIIGFIVTIYILEIRPESDFIIVIGIVFGVVTVLATNILTLMRTEEGNKKIDETQHTVNSRMSEMIEKVEALAHERGLREGQDKANARTDALAGQKPEGDK